ncbi:MAG: CoA pyrophosphatase [Bdellovibrionaceae bacterium]|nr:CoA pyrophosphatase [Pseudobdellovibrionaceae bacterium]
MATGSFREQLLSLMERQFPAELERDFARCACVAAILKGRGLEDLEIGYIHRAQMPLNNWSGQIAFPGGKREENDVSDLATALRETHEEIGLQLRETELIGRLDDLQARRQGQMLDFFIRPFIFYVERDFEIRLQTEEVADFFWVPLRELLDPARQTHFVLDRDGARLKLPAVQIKEGPPLWGLTYMMTQNLLTLLKP